MLIFFILGPILYYHNHGRLSRWIKWRACDAGEAKEGLENQLWRRWSNGRVGEWAFRHFTYVTAHCPTLPSLYLRHSSFSNPSVYSPTSQLILQPFRRFTYVTAHSPTLPLLLLRHSSFSNPSFVFSKSQALHIRHLASRQCVTGGKIRVKKNFTEPEIQVEG